MSGERVLVTGGSGFVGVHCILQLLKAGYRVRTTVRSLAREADVRAMLKVGGIEDSSALEFVAADLTADAGWAQAAAGCTYVHHVASPLPSGLPKHEDELILPAREGTLRVLRASRDAGVRRVVQTSSVAAIAYGHQPQAVPFDEASWTDLGDKRVQAYHKSKTLAERAAWEFIAKEGGALELSVVNPVGIFGPVFGPDYSPSILIVQRLMDGALPGCPKIHFAFVDVRDVVDLHLRAMTNPAAKGERFIAVAGESLSFLDIALILRKHMGAAARRVPTRQLPDWLMRAYALMDPEAKVILPELGQKRSFTNEKARRELGWTPRSNEEAILASAESLVRLRLLKDSKP
jgi:nucleoside-diphosphate-sugar epimerase